jgi:hypothetical protein
MILRQNLLFNCTEFFGWKTWREETTREDLAIGGRIILEWILGKCGGEMWTRCIWLRLGTSAGRRTICHIYQGQWRQYAGKCACVYGVCNFFFIVCYFKQNTAFRKLFHFQNAEFLQNTRQCYKSRNSGVSIVTYNHGNPLEERDFVLRVGVEMDLRHDLNGHYNPYSCKAFVVGFRIHTSSINFPLPRCMNRNSTQ